MTPSTNFLILLESQSDLGITVASSLALLLSRNVFEISGNVERHQAPERLWRRFQLALLTLLAVYGT